MMEHKYIIASDARDILGTWTDPNIVEVQSTPDQSSGARGVGTVSGVGTTKKSTAKQNRQQQQQIQQQQQQVQHIVITTAPSLPVATTSMVINNSSSNGGDGGGLVAGDVNILRPATTKLGKQRIRMKWTPEVNMFIIRSYFRITNLESNMKHYRDNLHKAFNDEYPNVNVCAQRIADQRRAIMKNRLLPTETVEQIRAEVAESLMPKRFLVIKTEVPPPTSSSNAFNPNLGGKEHQDLQQQQQHHQPQQQHSLT